MKKPCLSLIANLLSSAATNLMKYTKILFCLYLLVGLLFGKQCYSKEKMLYSTRSPDGKTVVAFGLNDEQQLIYRMDFQKKVVVKWSVLGLLTNAKNINTGITIVRKEDNKHREIFDWPLGEDAHIENNYQEIILHCKSTDTFFDIVGRVYNGSFAFKYVCKDLGQSQPVRLQKELTTFNLNDTYRIYQYHEESVFTPMSLNAMPGTSDLPSTLVSNDHLYLSIGEAENRNYSKSVLVKGAQPNSLALNFYIDTLYRDHKIVSIPKDTLITFKDSLVTPWRTISCAKSAIGLHEFSQLNLKLITPESNVPPTGVKPGKVFRVPITTQGGIEGADFAAKHHFQYIMLDAGWYGAEFRTTSDPTQPIAGLDLPAVINHATTKGIGVILYVNYVGLRAKLDTLLPLFKKWGVSGIKFGFVDGGSQRGLSWLDGAMKKVNDYGFILNVHDHYKPTGLSRRYPYNLSQEGIRGDENSPDAFHTTVLPYTRYLAGPADFTFCFPNSRDNFTKNLKVSKAQQMALTVIYFDPLQAIFWYGKSGDYTNDQEIEFFDQVPTIWDESHYLAGEIGESISVARKKDGIWYMGSAAGLNDWKTSLKLDFLDKGKTYVATIYEDDGNKGIRIKQINLKRNDVLPLEITAKAGQAIIFKPQTDNNIKPINR
jgi:alpha-glucosidase